MNMPDQFSDSHGGHMENGQPWCDSDWFDAFAYALETVRNSINARRNDYVLEPPQVDECRTYVGWIWEYAQNGYPNAYTEVMETRRERLYVPRSTPERLAVESVMPRLRSVSIGFVMDLGGSKVGDRPVPTRSRWSNGRNQSLTEALEGVWERTFGTKTRVDSRDLEFFPHLTRSHSFPLVPGTGAGTWNVAPVTRSRPYRGNGSGTTSGGQGMHVRQTKITGTGQSAVGRRRDV